jgi:hypothetical protein
MEMIHKVSLIQHWSSTHSTFLADGYHIIHSLGLAVFFVEPDVLTTRLVIEKGVKLASYH